MPRHATPRHAVLYTYVMNHPVHRPIGACVWKYISLPWYTCTARAQYASPMTNVTELVAHHFILFLDFYPSPPSEGEEETGTDLPLILIYLACDSPAERFVQSRRNIPREIFISRNGWYIFFLRESPHFLFLLIANLFPGFMRRGRIFLHFI